MSATVTSHQSNRLTIQLEIELNGSFFEQEQAILKACNEAGRLATKESLHSCDADGSPIQANGCKYTARTQSPKKYHTPFGCIELKRYVYQTSKGGKIYCPLEAKAHIIQGATPRMAQLLTGKYARLNAYETCDDLDVSHGVSVSRHYLQQVTDAVGAIAQAHEEDWSYTVPELGDDVAAIGFSLDGAMVLMRTGQWREAMVGSFSLYNHEGERLHSIYLGATPEYGKKAFTQKYQIEAQKLIARYPHAKKVGIADGAADNWKILNSLTDIQVLDFYHVTEYLSESSLGAFPKKEESGKRAQWLNEQCHRLKHEKDGAQSVFQELRRIGRKRLGASVKEKVVSANTYFENHLSMMDYAEYQKKCYPIGSGVVEAACKSLIKQRFCRSGMRWKEEGMKSVLSLRSLVLTKDRWSQFWDKINDHELYGVR